VIIFYQPSVPEGVLHLDEDESRHCVKVLRKSKGDEITVTDGRGFFYVCVITNDDARRCTFNIIDRQEEAKAEYRIHVAISPTKNADRIEWFVEKAVEFGINEITLVECDRTERTFIKSERLHKVAISAMKQSLKATLPRINDLTPFSQVVQLATPSRFIAYVDHSNPLHLLKAAAGFRDALVVIGPEGDFTTDELQLAITNQFVKVSLGNSRLRTETAGLAACQILHLVHT
jgi:16S rRNA (uracil1498-N3)-methyltransferase